MINIHFASGKSREIDETEFSKLPIKLQQRGIRIMIANEGRLMIPLNSNTIEFIEESEDEIGNVKEIIEGSGEIEEVIEPEETAVTVDELKGMVEELKQVQIEVDAKKDIEQKQHEAMEEILAKSSCTHDNLDIYKQATSKGERYFPVCSFCGKRERYIKADSLSDEQKETAKIWKD